MRRLIVKASVIESFGMREAGLLARSLSLAIRRLSNCVDLLMVESISTICLMQKLEERPSLDHRIGALTSSFTERQVRRFGASHKNHNNSIIFLAIFLKVRHLFTITFNEH